MALIDDLIAEGWLKTPEIINAFRAVKREDFLPDKDRDLAEMNEALPIGSGQTISQPLVVAFMLEQLQPRAGEKILDIGSGSGWTSALLAHIVSGGGLKSKTKSQKSKIFRFHRESSTKSGQIKNQKFTGKIIAIEIVPELKKFGEKNVLKYNFIKKGIAEFICADGSKGFEKEAPYDKILCSAAIQARDVPESWKEQLKVNGAIVSPIGSSIWTIIKKSQTEFIRTEFPGFAFVPLIGR